MKEINFKILNAIMLFLMVLVTVILIFAIYLGVKQISDYVAIEKDCLEEIAMQECSNKNLIFGTIFRDFDYKFSCKESEREVSSKMYRFLDEEKEGCRK